MLDALVHTLQGSPKEFHYSEQQRKVFTAASLMEALVKRYAKSDYAIQMLKAKLFVVQQEPCETVSDFISRVKKWGLLPKQQKLIWSLL